MRRLLIVAAAVVAAVIALAVVAVVRSGGGGDGGARVHTLKVTVTGNGSVTSSPAGVNCATSCTVSLM